MKHRIQYIDALRGFTMILVVLGHVPMYAYGGLENFSWSSFVSVFRLPLFFFISGFVFYKTERIWSISQTWNFIKNKFRVQVLTTAVFFMLFLYLNDINLIDALLDKYKAGYWFTLVLFFFFVIYCGISLCINKIDRDKHIYIYIAMSLPLLFFNTNGFSRIIADVPIINILSLQQLQYFIFFISGAIAKQYFHHLQKLLDDNKFITMIILVFVLTAFYCYGRVLNIVEIKLSFLLYGICGSLMVFAFFRKHESKFSQSTKVGQLLQYIGKRTLDIYLLHYFFIPKDVGIIGRYFYNNPNSTIELFVSLIIATMTILVCLGVSSVIRISPFLGKWLLAVKLK